jgi:hypothetical protein
VNSSWLEWSSISRSPESSFVAVRQEKTIRCGQSLHGGGKPAGEA